MVKRTDEKNIYYFVCPSCGNEVGKKEKKQTGE
jgi:predicted RNA-binding Zn-ribbon protein involved in translation (DUF1610 family)